MIDKIKRVDKIKIFILDHVSIDCLTKAIIVLTSLLLGVDFYEKWLHTRPNCLYVVKTLLWLSFSFSVVWQFILTYLQRSLHQKYSDLLKRSDEYKNLKSFIVTIRWDILSQALSCVMKNIGQSLLDSDRLNLYAYDGKNFNLIARYSPNCLYSQKGKNSGVLPYDGCLRKFWEGANQPVIYPKIKDVPWKKQIKQDFSKKRNIGEKRLESRFYWGVPILGNDRKPNYLFLFESGKTTRMSPEDLLRLRTEVEELKPYIFNLYKDNKFGWEDSYGKIN